MPPHKSTAASPMHSPHLGSIGKTSGSDVAESPRTRDTMPKIEAMKPTPPIRVAMDVIFLIVRMFATKKEITDISPNNSDINPRFECLLLVNLYFFSKIAIYNHLEEPDPAGLFRRPSVSVGRMYQFFRMYQSLAPYCA